MPREDPNSDSGNYVVLFENQLIQQTPIHSSLTYTTREVDVAAHDTLIMAITFLGNDMIRVRKGSPQAATDYYPLLSMELDTSDDQRTWIRLPKTAASTRATGGGPNREDDIYQRTIARSERVPYLRWIRVRFWIKTWQTASEEPLPLEGSSEKYDPFNGKAFIRVSLIRK